jgi:copper(I)-binding protein
MFLAAMIVIGAFGISACDGGQPRVSVESARAEMSPTMYGEGIVYLKIVNLGGKDTLTGIKTNIPGAAADLHEMKGNIMVLTKSLQIPAKNTIDLAPMGTHIMIENMPKDVKEGHSFTLTLVFKRSGEMQIPLTFMKAQPMMPGHEHHGE